MRKLTSRLTGAALEAALISILVVGLLAVPALAGRGGNRPAGGGDTSSSLSLVMVDPADTTANHGDLVTFDVSTTATDKPNVNVRCSQDGAGVYDAWAGFYVGAWFGQTFELASTNWTSGGADCTARLVYWGRNGRERVVTSMNFYVEP